MVTRATPRKNGMDAAERRVEAVDAAIEVLAKRGARGLTHREIDRSLQWPIGSTTNYYPRRNDLLTAIAARIIQRDLEDFAVLETDLANRGDMTVDLLAWRLVRLFEYWVSPEHRYRTLARAEILFETTRNQEVETAARDQMVIAESSFHRIFATLGSADPVGSAQLLSFLVFSMHVGACLQNSLPGSAHLFSLVRNWISISIDHADTSKDKMGAIDS